MPTDHARSTLIVFPVQAYALVVVVVTVSVMRLTGLVTYIYINNTRHLRVLFLSLIFCYILFMRSDDKQNARWQPVASPATHNNKIKKNKNNNNHNHNNISFESSFPNRVHDRVHHRTLLGATTHNNIISYCVRRLYSFLLLSRARRYGYPN